MGDPLTIEPAFRAFGAAHLVVIALTILVPLGLAAGVKLSRSQRVEHAVAICLSVVLFVNHAGYAVYEWLGGNVRWQQLLPMHLCDWAMVVVIVALVTRRRPWFEVAYFWGIGGTLQAILTPNLRYGFPDIRFITFFVGHSGIVAGVIYLMAMRRLRPTARSIWRTLAWSELYLVVALLVNWLTGENYGFLSRKPPIKSLLSLLSDWQPLYILEMNIIAVLFFLALYAPFFIADRFRWTATLRRRQDVNTR